eukprot:9504054-Pyramimonas_sp.AAC.1
MEPIDADMEMDSASACGTAVSASRARKAKEGTRIVCHLCVTPSPYYKTAWGLDWCQECFAKIRSHHRQIRGGADGRAKFQDDKTMMHQHPEQWRAQPIFQGGQVAQQAKAMSRMNNKFEETAKLNQEVVIQDEVAYTKSQFKIHRKEEDPDDDLESVDLEDEFDELFQAQEKDGNYHVYEKSMNSVVRLLDKPRKRSLNGKQSPEGTRRGDGPSAAA